MMKSAKDEILNGVIGFLTKVLDHYEETNGIIIARKFEDAARATNSKTGSSCTNYASSVFGEINIEDMGVRETCKTKGLSDCGREQEISSKVYTPTLTLDFFGCGAFDVAKIVMDALELHNLRALYLPKNIAYVSHSDLIDVTRLQETLHQERVTFDINLEYCCETIFDMPSITMSECMKNFLGINKHGDFNGM